MEINNCTCKRLKIILFYNWQNNGASISGFGTDIWGPNGNPTSNGLQLINNSAII